MLGNKINDLFAARKIPLLLRPTWDMWGNEFIQVLFDGKVVEVLDGLPSNPAVLMAIINKALMKGLIRGK